MRDRTASSVKALTISAMVCAAGALSGCSTERPDGRNAGVTATGNTGRIGGRIDSLAASAAARQTAQNVWSVKVFLYMELMTRPGDSLCDSVTAVPGGTYEFKSLPDGSFKVYAVSDANGWRSDTLRAVIQGGADVPLAVPVKAPATGTGVRNGMTWGKRKRDAVFGIDFVACHAPMDGVSQACNPTAGDQPCSAVLPLLCSKSESLARPAYEVDYSMSSLSMNRAYYGGWQGGRTALAARVEGRTLRSKAVADSICVANLGTGWVVSGFHDGLYFDDMDSLTYHDGGWDATQASSGGWGFYSYTANLPMNARFWVYIDDQPGNCWDP